MAKRETGVGNMKKSHSKKTKKRIAIKYAKLAERKNNLLKKSIINNN